MLEKIIREGDKVELHRLSATGSSVSDGKYYVSSVYGLLGDNKVGLLMPTEHSKLVDIETGERFRIVFYGDNGLFQCKSILKERFKKDRFFVAVFKFISDLEKLQRRQFFRIDCILRLRYRSIGPDTFGEWKEATAIDISGGGMRFNSSDYSNEDKEYEIEFDIPLDNAMSHFSSRARVVYISDLANRPGMYEYRLEFQNLSPADREAIVRFVFDEERKRRKRVM